MIVGFNKVERFGFCKESNLFEVLGVKVGGEGIYESMGKEVLEIVNIDDFFEEYYCKIKW